MVGQGGGSGWYFWVCNGITQLGTCAIITQLKYFGVLFQQPFQNSVLHLLKNRLEFNKCYDQMLFPTIPSSEK